MKNALTMISEPTSLPFEVQTFAVGEALTPEHLESYFGFSILQVDPEGDAVQTIMAANHEDVACDLCLANEKSCVIAVDDLRYCPISSGPGWTSPVGSVYQPACLAWRTASRLETEGKNRPRPTRILYPGSKDELAWARLTKAQIKTVEHRRTHGLRGPCPVDETTVTRATSEAAPEPRKRVRYGTDPVPRQVEHLNEAHHQKVDDWIRNPIHLPYAAHEGAKSESVRVEEDTTAGIAIDDCSGHEPGDEDTIDVEIDPIIADLEALKRTRAARVQELVIKATKGLADEVAVLRQAKSKEETLRNVLRGKIKKKDARIAELEAEVEALKKERDRTAAWWSQVTTQGPPSLRSSQV